MAEEEAKPVEPAAVEAAATNAEEDAEAIKVRKRKERLEQNRISARESRKRKKTMIEELQRTVITLSRENKELNERNENLRRQLMEIGSKYPNIVPMHAIMGGTMPAAPPPGAPPVPPGPPAPPDGFVAPQGYPVTVQAIPAAPPPPPQPQTIQVHAVPAAPPPPPTVQAVAPAATAPVVAAAPVIKAEAAPTT